MLIGLTSKGRQAGKDTAAGFMREWAEENNLTFERLAFADLPKLLVAEILKIKGRDREDVIQRVDKFKEYGVAGYSMHGTVPVGTFITGRDFIINLCGELGTGEPSGARKLFGEDFWIDAALPRRWRPDADITAITDVRDNREAARIQYHKGRIVKIVNNRAEAPGGRSEKGIDRKFIAHRWYNNYSLEVFEDTVKGWLDENYAR